MPSARTKQRQKQRESAVREPSARALTTWTVAQIRQAEVLADGGNLRYAADLCDAMLADDHIQGVLTARTRGLLRIPVEFEASGDKRRSKKAIRALEAEEDFWAAYPESSLGQLFDWGVILGVGLGQQIPQKVASGRVVPKLNRYHERWLRYDWPTRSWRITTEGFDEIEAMPGDGRWVIHTPSGDYRPWNNGAWRALSRWWLLKEYARSDYARYGEAGGPRLVGFGSEDSTANAREELANDIANLGRSGDTGICLPNGYDLKVIQSVASTYKMYRDQIDLANLGMTIRLAGQNLTTNVSGGSLAAAKVHLIIRNDLVASDAEAGSTTLHDQSLVYWADWNFGSMELAPWPMWPTDPPEDELAKAQTRDAQGKAIVSLKAAGVKLDPVLEEFGLEIDPDAEKRAEEMAAQAQQQSQEDDEQQDEAPQQ